MKKLLVVLAAVAFATGLQAATVSWKATKQDALKGVSVYTFNGGDYSTVLGLLEAGQDGATAEAFAASVLNYALADVNTSAKATSISANKGTGGSTVELASANTMFQMFVTGDLADGGTYTMTSVLDASAAAFTPPQQKTVDFAITGDMFSKTGTIGGSDTPEPTSGLLLLLGVAGLALRRKQA